MKEIIVHTYLKTIMGKTMAKRIATVCTFTEDILAAVIGGVAISILDYDNDNLKLRLCGEAVAVKNLFLIKEEQKVKVEYIVRRYAKNEDEKDYWATTPRSSNEYPNEVFVETSGTYDVDYLKPVIEFEYI